MTEALPISTDSVWNECKCFDIHIKKGDEVLTNTIIQGNLIELSSTASNATP